jgi:hypothetical protein
MKEKIIGFKLVLNGGSADLDFKKTYDVDEFDSTIIKQSRNSIIGTLIHNETKIDQRIGKHLINYVNEIDLGKIIKEETKSGYIYIDAGGYELELIYDRLKETYDLYGVFPQCLKDLEAYIDKILSE